MAAVSMHRVFGRLVRWPSRGTSKTGVYDQFQAKLIHRERRGHAELCHCVLSETTQVSCAWIPIFFSLMMKQAPLRASTIRLQSLEAADPRSQLRPPNFGGQRNCPSHDPSNSPHVLEHGGSIVSVHFAPLQTHTCPKTRERVGGDVRWSDSCASVWSVSGTLATRRILTIVLRRPRWRGEIGDFWQCRAGNALTGRRIRGR